MVEEPVDNVADGALNEPFAGHTPEPYHKCMPKPSEAVGNVGWRIAGCRIASIELELAAASVQVLQKDPDEAFVLGQPKDECYSFVGGDGGGHGIDLD